MKISEGGGNIQAEVIPAKTVLLAAPHGNEGVGDQLLVSLSEIYDNISQL